MILRLKSWRIAALHQEEGEPLDDLDLQIASLAPDHNLPLATNKTF